MAALSSNFSIAGKRKRVAADPPASPLEEKKIPIPRTRSPSPDPQHHPSPHPSECELVNRYFSPNIPTIIDSFCHTDMFKRFDDCVIASPTTPEPLYLYAACVHADDSLSIYNLNITLTPDALFTPSELSHISPGVRSELNDMLRTSFLSHVQQSIDSVSYYLLYDDICDIFTKAHATNHIHRAYPFCLPHHKLLRSCYLEIEQFNPVYASAVDEACSLVQNRAGPLSDDFLNE
jgi:hypothetical protein